MNSTYNYQLDATLCGAYTALEQKFSRTGFDGQLEILAAMTVIHEQIDANRALRGARFFSRTRDIQPEACHNINMSFAKLSPAEKEAMYERHNG